MRALTLSFNVYLVSRLASVVLLATRLFQADLEHHIALLVLGIYKDLKQRYGLRRLVILNLCFAALAVLYSVVACMSYLRKTRVYIVHDLVTYTLGWISLAPSSLDDRSCPAFLYV